jgi:hypothetical protein
MRKSPAPIPVLDADGETVFLVVMIDQGLRYNLEALERLAKEERAFDESTRARVTQEDIAKLIEKRKKRRG